MNAKQMYRALKKYGLSVAYIPQWAQWYAGAATPLDEPGEILLNVRNPVPQGEHDRCHLGDTPEEAVEDYCNARNLEWDT
jgi:hypothetical protein